MIKTFERNSFFVGSSERNPGLDVLRAIAIILVLFRHFLDRNPQYDLVIPDFVVFMGLFGWSGVDLFYVLSGFLIFSIIFEQEKIDEFKWQIFYFKRVLRIWPAYFLSLFVCAWTGVFNIEWIDIIYFLLFLQNYVGPLSEWNGGVYWSIAVEEHFYIITPLMLMATSRVRKYRLQIILSLLVLPFVIRSLLLLTYVEDDMARFYSQIYFPTHARLDAMMWGVLCAHLWSSHREVFLYKQVKTFILLGTAVMLVLSLWATESLNRYSQHPSFVAGSIGFMVVPAFWSGVLMISQVYRVFDRFGHGILKITAYLSFSMYLYHIIVLRFLSSYFEGSSDPINLLFHVAAFVVLTYIAGLGSYLLIERIFLIYKNRWFKTHSTHF